MRKLLLSSVALVGLTAGATAADLPRRTVIAPAPVPYVAVPVFTWTGFYIGVNAGAAFRDDNRDNTCIDTFGTGFGDCFGGSGLSVRTNNGLAPVVPLTGLNTFGFGFNNNRNNDAVFAGGGQIGYNYQFTPGSGFVIGIEADIQGLANNNRDDNVFGFGGFGGLGNNGIFTAAPVAPIAPGSGIANPTGVGNGALGNVALFNGGNRGFGGCGNGNGFGSGTRFDDCRPDWFATVRGKLGYAWDRFLIYGTGGVAFRDDNNNCDNNSFGCGFGFGTGLTSGASLVGTGFFVNAASAAAGNLIGPSNTFFFTNNRNNNNVGWTAGGGLSYAFTNNLVATVEGLYVSFDRNRDNFNGALLGGGAVGVSNTGAPVLANQFGLGFDNNRRNRDDFAVVRAKLDWKFGSLFGL